MPWLFGNSWQCVLYIMHTPTSPFPPLSPPLLSLIPLSLPQVDNYKEKELTELFRKYEVKAPVTGNPVTDPVYFNLMFATSIGPGGQISGYVP